MRQVVETKDRQPLKLYLISLTEFWDRFGFYGLQALLVLYVTKVLLFSDSAAYSLYGTFTALTFATGIVGGLLADRFLGARHAILLGGVLMVVGNFLLFFPGLTGMYFGLSVLIIGIGLFKPNNANYVGALYEKTDVRREGGFSLFYMAMNAGALLGPVLYGVISSHYGWHLSFLISAIGTAIALAIFIIKHHPETSVEKASNFRVHRALWLGITSLHVVYAGVFIAIFLLVYLLQHSDIFGSLLILVGIITLIGIAVIAIKNDSVTRNHIIGITILSFFCLFFFAGSLQTATTLTLFIERNINRTFFEMKIPTMMFLSLEPFFIIIIAPFVARVWTRLARAGHDLFPSTKILIGLSLAVISFSIFALSASLSQIEQGRWPLLLVVLGNATLGLGELCILPVVFSTLTRVIPIHLRGTMMGVAFLAFAYSGYLAGAFAKIISAHSVVSIHQHTVVNYSKAFIQVSISMLVITLVMLCINPWLKRLLSEKAV